MACSDLHGDEVWKQPIEMQPTSTAHTLGHLPALQAIDVLLLLLTALLGGLLVADLPADLLQDPLLLLPDGDTGNRDVFKAHSHNLSHLHLYLGSFSRCFNPRGLHSVNLSEERETIYRCRYSKDATDIAKNRCCTMLRTIFK